jgi:hypothetical protein
MDSGKNNKNGFIVFYVSIFITRFFYGCVGTNSRLPVIAEFAERH